ncbi:MAG: DUF4861 domain-containing protein [Bacteroides sp.]|nr:DUF4861 domain-containing protein [Bacteroides sp.]
MKKLALLVLAVLSLNVVAGAQNQKKDITVEITNPSNAERKDVPVVIRLNEADPGFKVRSATVYDGTTEIPSQLDDLTLDLIADELAFVIDMPANTTKEVKVTLSSQKSEKNYTSRVFAEMLISDKKGNHVPIQSLTIPGSSNVYNQLHHHGPAFESELVAYRIYFDQKQTVDLYGKFNKGLEIEESQFYPTDEQLARGFGDDVLRVSGSCGLGALKGWNGSKATHIEPVQWRTESILAYGPIRTVVDVKAQGWEYQGSELTMTNRYILYAGHRDAEVEVYFEQPLKEETFATGVQDILGSVSYSDNEGLIGCWGTDWPVNDTIKYAKETVGLGTYIPRRYVKSEIKDKPNYLYQIQAPGETGFKYHITFTSMKETFGYKTPEAWFAHIREWKKELETPCTIRIK